MRNIALVNSHEELRNLPEGTFVFGSQGGLMVRGSYGGGEMVYYNHDDASFLIPFSKGTIWGIPLSDVRVEGNNTVSVVNDFYCDMHGGEEYRWAKHLLSNMPSVSIDSTVNAVRCA